MTDTLPYMASDKKAPDTESVRLSRSIMKKVRVIAPKLDMTVPEYLASRLADPVEADYAAVGAAIVKEASKPKRKAD